MYTIIFSSSFISTRFLFKYFHILVTGYTGNGYHCTDINECEVNNGGCSTSPMVDCINTRVSF